MLKALKNTIKAKIIRITVLVTLLMAIVTASICFSSFQTLMAKSLSESTHYTLKIIMNTFSSNMEPIITFSNWCKTKDSIAKYLITDEEHLRSISLVAWQRLKEEYLNNPSANFINRVVIGNDKRQYLHTSILTSSNAFDMVSRIKTLSYFNELYLSDEIKWVGLVEDPFSDTHTEPMIPIIRPIDYPYGSYEIGWCYISISPKLLTNSIKNYDLPNDSDLYLTIGDKVYQIINNAFIEVTPPKEITTEFKDGSYYESSYIDASGKERTLITVSSSIKGWYLTQTLSESRFQAQKNIYYGIIVFICFIVLSLGFSLTVYMTQIINVPLSKITHKINLISKGDFSYAPEIEWDNEFGDIGKGINTLSKDVVQLMDTRIETEKEKRELEYQMLQSQINPHFLYNTLNSIKWMATIQHATGIGEMTTALSRLLKSISKDTKQIVTLKDELNLLDNYFLIQKYRYGGTLSLEYTIETPDLYDCEILKFTLQPIVENAIFHGIEPKGEIGIIKLHAYKSDENNLIIEITDNGVGMTPEQIAKVLSGSPQGESDFFKKIGISNVNQRIIYTFGSEYGLCFTSELQKFTTVTVTLPYRKN